MPKRSELSGNWSKILTVLAVSASLYHIYALGMVAVGIWQLRVIHLMAGLIMVPLVFKAMSSSPDKRPSLPDMIMAALGVVVSVYALLNEEGIVYRAGVDPTNWDIIMGTIMLALIIELTRRSLGWPLVIVICVFMCYAFFAPYFPGVLKAKSYNYPRVISQMLSLEGFYGIPMGASSTFVFLFVLFGAFLKASGVGDFIIDLSYALAGRTRGGPAKVSIFASGMFGTVAGHAVANVVTTGAFTIPLMKKTGFRPYFAGAVEAAASTGGQLMPPVMGAAAFLVAEVTNIPYNQIATAGILPAVLFYLALFMMIDLEAGKEGLKGLPGSELPQLSQVIMRWGHLAVPVLVLLYMLLIVGSSPIKAALYSTGTCVIFSWLRKETAMGYSKLILAMESGAMGALNVIIACGAAGVVVAVIYLTGVGLKLAAGIIALAGGNLLIACVVTMVVTLVLSMGLPTVGAYIIAGVTMGPVLTQMGLSLLQAHMFIFYFSCMSAVTPPVALAAFPAAGIAGANPMKVGFTAWRLAIVAFIIPYMFIYSPTLLLKGSIMGIAFSSFTALMGTACLAVALSGWLLTRATLVERGLFLAAAMTLIFPGVVTDTIGGGLLLTGLIIHAIRWRAIKAQNNGNAGKSMATMETADSEKT